LTARKFISTLLGNNPGPLRAGKVDGATACARGSSGASLRPLERRPDFARPSTIDRGNAQIGVRKQPTSRKIALTANSGFRVQRLPSLFTWSGWIVEFRRITSAAHLRRENSFRCKVLRGRQQEALLILPADHPQPFGGVSDALGEYRKDREFREQQSNSRFPTKTRRGFPETRYRGVRHQLLGGADERTIF